MADIYEVIVPLLSLLLEVTVQNTSEVGLLLSSISPI